MKINFWRSLETYFVLFDRRQGKNMGNPKIPAKFMDDDLFYSVVLKVSVFNSAVTIFVYQSS